MSASLTCTKLTLLIVAGVLIQITGLLLFVFGFFPVKPDLSGRSGLDSFQPPACVPVHNESERDLAPDVLKSRYQELSGIPPSYDRLILMVIDGLPAEFVLGKDDQSPSLAFVQAMPYIHSLLKARIAIGYHARAAPPTVTMPRIKAMISGAIGGFLDVALNFNTQALQDDNLLGQFFDIGWKMVMHGDETWLKLFPGLFMRHDGVSSFFVKDTVQVDKNVSRHLKDELSREDWSLLILHYLGLDHVGHIGGRNSILMAPKLTEMDDVVKMIHMNAVKQGNKRTLLVVVSDHGMTESGNHGGSSFEEIDSLLLFIGLRKQVSTYESSLPNKVNQVDIAPTLALLFGVPIPKNNVGVVVPGTTDSMTGIQMLRALELNSWQLLRKLRAQLPDLHCQDSLCDDFRNDQGYAIRNCEDSSEKFCCLYMNAAVPHRSLLSNVSRSNSPEDYSIIAAAYYEFLKTASEWLSRRATDKPVTLLAFGLASMILSCLMLVGAVYLMCNETYPEERRSISSNTSMGSSFMFKAFHIDEAFTLGAILLVVTSMGSSSMVEEEQYIWHFLNTTIYILFLRESLQKTIYSSMVCPLFVLLISGRILRGWHQGGVNWTHFPDITKWLDQAGSGIIHLIHLVSGILVFSFSMLTLSFVGLKRKFVLLVAIGFLIPAFMVLYHITKYNENMFMSSSDAATSFAQRIFATLAIATIATVFGVPWFISVPVSGTCSTDSIYGATSSSVGSQYNSLRMELKGSLYVIGWAYNLSWCLLQLVLQQPVNSAPILLLLLQILACFLYYSRCGSQRKQMVEVAALYYLGMAGHFSLGNSNSLATIDVAGAFIGMSKYSTVLSGILMFFITYASPMLLLLSLVMYTSFKDTHHALSSLNGDSGQLLKIFLGFPCLVPLAVNSVLLVAYTLVLLLMRNHLFVWSVFSPKYLYVCATTVCVYIGVSIVAATVIYTYAVLALRREMQGSASSDGTRYRRFDLDNYPHSL